MFPAASVKRTPNILRSPAAGDCRVGSPQMVARSPLGLNWNTSSGKVATEIFHPDASLDEDALAKEIARYNRFISR